MGVRIEADELVPPEVVELWQELGDGKYPVGSPVTYWLVIRSGRVVTIEASGLHPEDGRTLPHELRRMTYYEDLTPCGYFPKVELVAIGWLGSEHSFEQGPVGQPFLEALRRLLVFPWFPYAFAGGHLCEWCGLVWGTANLLVPSAHGVFVCPELILHYIEQHNYRPPQQFQDAVLACPATDTDAYFDLLEASGLIAEWEKDKKHGNLRAYHAQVLQFMRERGL